MWKLEKLNNSSIVLVDSKSKLSIDYYVYLDYWLKAMFCYLNILIILPKIKAFSSTEHQHTISYYVDHDHSEATEFYDYNFDHSDDDETTTYAEYEYLDYENTIDLEKIEANPDLEKEDQSDLEKKDYTHYGLIDKLGGDDAKSKGHQQVMRLSRTDYFVTLIALKLLQYIPF